MKKIKKIFCDIDGTLLHSGNLIKDLNNSAKFNIPKRNIKMINKLDDIEFNLASGRIEENINMFTKRLDKEVTYKISMNGSVVTKNNEIIFENKIKNKQAIKTCKYLDDNNLFYFLFTSKGIFTGNKKIRNPIAKKIRKWVGVPIKSDNITAQDLLKDKKVTVYKFSINFNVSWYNLSDIVEKLNKEFPKMYITESSKYSIDINSNNISKGEIIKKICKKDKVKLEEIAVIGDSGNDLSMFELTPYSFCINHASDDVKDEANYIVHNVAEAIRTVKQINQN